MKLTDDPFAIPADDDAIHIDKDDIRQVAVLYDRYGAGAVLRTLATLVEVDASAAPANRDHLLSRLLFSNADAFDEAVERARTNTKAVLS